MDDFVRCATLLASPGTPQALRKEADGWLAAFRRDSPAGWGVALGVLQAAPAAALPREVRLQAASLLAWKVKRQLAQLQPERQAELAEALTALAAAAATDAAVVRALCVGLANLAIRCEAWARPLDTLGARLSPARMLELLTILPQECEDAVAAAQAASAEVAWALKARGHEWSPEVAAWLHALHASAATPAGGARSPGTPGASSPAAPAQAGGEDWQQLTLAVLRCFTAWTKWGCLQYVDAGQAAYFTRLAGELLFAPDPARRLPFHPACLPAAVDAAAEIVEHATESLQPLLLQLAGALPAHAAALAAAGGDGATAAEELAHVFSLFCGTHCQLCMAEGPQGQAMRQGLLQLLALPAAADGEGGGAALPAMGALADLLEHAVALHRGERADSEEEQGQGSAARPVGPAERQAFAAAALDVLLVQLQPFEAAFQPAAAEAAADGGDSMQPGTHSPDGVPDALRREAAPVIDHIGDLLGADATMQRLVAHAEAAAAQHGVRSTQAQAALDVCLHMAEGMSGLLESCCGDREAGDPAPAWLASILRLYSLVPEADGSSGSSNGAPAPPLTILHADFLSSFCQLGPLATPLLLPMAQPGAAQQQQQQQALTHLVLTQALRALSGQPRTADVAAGSTQDVMEQAADALRVVCSCAASSGLPTSPELLAGVQQGMALLQQPPTSARHQGALAQVVAGLVHALHGVPPGDPQLRAQAEAAVQQHVLSPLAEALQGVQSLAAADGGGLQAHQAAQARAAVWRLHSALRQLQALLNGLESYAWCTDSPRASSCSDGGASNGGSQSPADTVARGVSAAAVGTFLACWPQLAQACAWMGRLPAAPPGGGGLAAARQEAFQELSHCLCSCMALDQEAFQCALPSFAQAAADCFFLPGAAVLGRPLIQALEAYGATQQAQQPLLATVAAILAAPPARRLAALRGGDADPETAQELLSLLGCCLRQACQWRAVAEPAAVEAVLRLGVPLAVANAACSHRGTSLQALATLAALLALLLAADSPLHGALLGFAAQQGPALAEGLLLALLSLSSGSHLPKVVSLVSDTSLLAATLAAAQLAQQQGGAATAEAVAQAAGALLGGWMAAASATVAQSGAFAERSISALLAAWDWQPVLQQAALQLTQGGAGGAEMPQVRRALQRSVRQLCSVLQRSY